MLSCCVLGKETGSEILMCRRGLARRQASSGGRGHCYGCLERLGALHTNTYAQVHSFLAVKSTSGWRPEAPQSFPPPHCSTLSLQKFIAIPTEGGSFGFASPGKQISAPPSCIHSPLQIPGKPSALAPPCSSGSKKHHRFSVHSGFPCKDGSDDS